MGGASVEILERAAETARQQIPNISIRRDIGRQDIPHGQIIGDLTCLQGEHGEGTRLTTVFKAELDIAIVLRTVLRENEGCRDIQSTSGRNFCK